MWPPLPSHPQHTTLALFFCMSVTRLLSECRMLYDWNYDGDSVGNTELREINPELPSGRDPSSTDGHSPQQQQHARTQLDMASRRRARPSQRGVQQQQQPSAPNLQGLHPQRPELTTPPPPQPLGPQERADHQGSLSSWLSLQEAKPGLPRHMKPVSDRLTPQQALALRERLKGLYALLKSHPALMDRRLQVGSKKPYVPPALRHQPLQDKRSFTHLYSREVCPSRTEWRLLHVARDINNTQVQIFQPRGGSTGHQWFYTTACLHDSEGEEDQTPYPGPSPDCPTCCQGINTHRYHSHCMTKTSLMMALVRKPEEEQFDWNWIQVNSSCSCYISPA